MNIVSHTRSCIMRRLSLFIDTKAYLDSSVSVTTMARKLDTNRMYLAEVLRTEYDQTITGFISYHRIRHAKELILHSDRSLRVKELAAMSGYRSSTSFYRNFLKSEGCAPSEWIARQCDAADGRAGQVVH